MAGQSTWFKIAMRVSAAILACVAVSAAASAQSLEQFFKDRQLTLLVGGGAGGSVDLYSRCCHAISCGTCPATPRSWQRIFPALEVFRPI